MNWRIKLKKALKMELKEHDSSYRVYMVLRCLVILLLIVQIINHNWQSAFLCILTLFLLIIPSLIQVTLKIELPTVLEITLLLFIFAAEILGEIHEFYIIFPFWDTMLHTMNGFLAAAVGFSLVDLLNRSDKLMFNLSPLFTVIVAFSFSMTIGVLWEIFEFTMDQLFLFDMQKDTIIHQFSTVTLDPSGGNTPQIIKNITEVTLNGTELGLGGYLDIGIIDTMYDLIVNLIGAAVFSVFGYAYLNTRGKKDIIKNWIPRQKDADKDFLEKVYKEVHKDSV